MRYGIAATVLVFAGYGFVCRVASADLVTGFEPPAYAPGSILGQQGWTGNPSENYYSNYAISTSNPYAGTQDLSANDVQSVPAAPYGLQVISPDTGTENESTLTSFKFDISGVTPSNTPGASAEHNVYLVSNAATDLDPKFGLNNYVGGVSFQSDGEILVEEFYPDFGGYMSLTDTGVQWTPNTYHSFAISVTSSGDMKYTYDGALLADTSAFYETSVGNVVFFQDFGYSASETARFDNLSVTALPEPASFGLLSVAVLFAARRRKRR